MSWLVGQPSFLSSYSDCKLGSRRRIYDDVIDSLRRLVFLSLTIFNISVFGFTICVCQSLLLDVIKAQTEKGSY